MLIIKIINILFFVLSTCLAEGAYPVAPEVPKSKTGSLQVANPMLTSEDRAASKFVQKLIACLKKKQFLRFNFALSN